MTSKTSLTAKTIALRAFLRQHLTDRPDGLTVPELAVLTKTHEADVLTQLGALLELQQVDRIPLPGSTRGKWLARQPRPRTASKPAAA